MKLVTFEVLTALGRFRRLGAVVDGNRVVDLNAAYAWLLAEDGHPRPKQWAAAMLPPAMAEFLDLEGHGMQAARQVLDRLTPQLVSPPQGVHEAKLVFSPEEVQLCCPLPVPNSLRDFMAFEQHMQAGSDRRGVPIPEQWYKMPVYYKGNPRTFVGPEANIPWPAFTQKLDYELELACILGKKGKNISVEDAPGYIAGYAILNDFSARDIQLDEMRCRLGPAKGKDFATAMGPWLVTPDEADPKNMTMTAKINGELWSEGQAGTCHWTFAQMIAHVSQDETLYPGDVLGSGTVGGGCGLDLNKWIQLGDVVELEITGLGVLRNRVVK